MQAHCEILSSLNSAGDAERELMSIAPSWESSIAGGGVTTVHCERILVVDDSTSQRLLLKALLEKHGYKVDVAKSGKEAVAAFSGNYYRIIISDWIMPGMTGPELCKEVRALNQTNYSYFILSSSKNEKRDIADGLDAGADDFIAKPINEHELLARIRAGTRTVRLQEEISERNRDLVATHDELHAAYDQINEDLRIAARMLKNFVPAAHSQCERLDIATTFMPCLHLGGDLVGYFSKDQNNVVAYSIDVSGHGIPAALLSTVLSQSLSGRHWSSNVAFTQSPNGEAVLREPHETAYVLNERFQDWGQLNQYFTMAYAKLDPMSGKGELCQAGHPAPAIIRASGGIEFIGSGGMPIGMLPTATFDSVPFHLSEGDILVLYTDGITEAELPDGTLLGEEGLLEVLERLRGCPMDHFGTELVALVSELSGNVSFSDDVSAIAVTRLCCRAPY